MGNKNILIVKGIMMLLAYAVVTAAVLYYLNGGTIDKWKTVTWIMFMVFGIRSCYLWFQRKLEELSDKEK